MKTHTIILIFVLFVVLLFAGINWSLFARQDSINFIFFSIEAPLGVIMLGTVGVLSIIYLLFIGRLEVSSMMEARKNSKALEEARELASSKEKSRIGELERTISDRIDGFGSRFATLEEQVQKMGARFDAVEGGMGDIVSRFDEEGVFIVKGPREEGGSGKE